MVSVKRGYSKFIKFIHFTGDVFLLNIAFLTSYLFYNKIYPLFSFNDHYSFLLIAFNLLWVIIALLLHPYNIDRVVKPASIIGGLLKIIFLHVLFIFAFLFFIKGYYYSRGQLFFTYVAFCFLVTTWRLAFIYLIKAYRKSGSNFRTVVIIGAGPLGQRVYNYFKSDPSLGFKFLGFFDDAPHNVKNQELVLGSVSELKEYAKKERIDEVYYTLPISHTYKIMDLMNYADNNLIRFKIIPDFRAFLDKKVTIDFYNNIPVLSLRKDPMENVFNLFLKRAFDIVFSISIILLIFPWLLPLISLLIKLTSPGPVFFKQKRTGRDNKEFFCYKFRTMKLNKEADQLQASTNDPRITPIGRFLRKTSLDELPQFFNVLIGDMTVVGPRPHMLKHTDDYSVAIDKFMVRHFVKPGITGWAQVRGYRGETQNPDKMVKRISHDLWYMENWSFLLDIKIILLTIRSVFKGDKNVA